MVHNCKLGKTITPSDYFKFKKINAPFESAANSCK